MITNRVLFFTTHAGNGGVRELWTNLADGFRSKGDEVSLWACYPQSDEQEDTNDWNFVLTKRVTSIWGMVILLWNLIGLFRRDPPRAVFTAMPIANIMIPLASVLACRPIRVIMTHHVPMTTYHWALAVAERIAARLGPVRAIVSVSRAVASSLGRYSGRSRKFHVVPNALPPHLEILLDELRANAPQVYPRRVVALGRLSEQKNFAVLVRAAALMPDVTVEIAGDGPEAATLKEIAHVGGVSARVKFLGQVERHAALAVLAQGGVFAQPSLYEGHSLALIEAARLGLPLVVSDIPVQIDGITGSDGTICGLAVAPTDAAGLAERCLKILDDPEVFRLWSNRSTQLATSHSFAEMLSAYRKLSSDRNSATKAV